MGKDLFAVPGLEGRWQWRKHWNDLFCLHQHDPELGEEGKGRRKRKAEVVEETFPLFRSGGGSHLLRSPPIKYSQLPHPSKNSPGFFH